MCVQAVVKGNKDAGYGETASMALEAALCLATQGRELEEQGLMQAGVLTPATALGSVLIKRLRDAGITFEITRTGKEPPPKGPLDALKAPPAGSKAGLKAATGRGFAAAVRQCAVPHAHPALRVAHRCCEQLASWQRGAEACSTSARGAAGVQGLSLIHISEPRD